MSRSLVIQTSFLGDVILTTPLLTALAERGPVDVVTTRAAAGLLTGHPAVRRVVVYDKRGSDAGLSGFLRLRGTIRAAGSEDIAYLAQGSARTGALAYSAGYRTRVGFATSGGRLWYTRHIPYDGARHHAARLLMLAGIDTPNDSAIRPRLYPSAHDDAAVDALLAEAGHDGEPLVALAPGSVWRTKRWPYFAQLAAALAPADRVVVIGSAEDRALAQEIHAAAGARVIDATGRLSLLGSAALLARARILVTNDSAPLHLASAMNTPTVAVFGPTVPRFGFGPLATRHEIAEFLPLDCRPCHAHGPMRCPLTHFRCMRDLTADHVRHLVATIGA